MINRYLTYLLLVLLAASCKKSGKLDCFTSNGAEVTETRNVGEFDIVKVFDKIDVTIIKGTEYKVEVMAGSHIIKTITTLVKDRELSINNENTCNFVRGYKKKIHINITVPHISRVENRGVGTMDFDSNYSQDSIKVLAESSGDIYVNGTFSTVATSSHGNGDIYLEGKCDRLYVYMYGTNFLHAETLDIRTYIYVETFSIGDCYVNASIVSAFDSRIWRSGNVYYTGSPPAVSVNYEDNAKGRLMQKN